MFPEYQGSVDLPDTLSLDKAWLCGTEGSANLLASKVLETPQNSSSSNGDRQLQSNYPLSLSQINDSVDLHTPPWFIIKSSILEQRIKELYKQ